VNVYNYFFYRLYCWSAQWKDDVAPPEFNEFAIVSAVMVGHAILFVQLVELIFGFRIIALLPKYSVYVAVIVFAVPNYFILLYRNRFKKIISNFAPEPPQLRRRRGGRLDLHLPSCCIIVSLRDYFEMALRRRVQMFTRRTAAKSHGQTSRTREIEFAAPQRVALPAIVAIINW